VTRPVKELKGFRKVMIPKGTTQTVEFSLSEEDLRFYGRDMRFDSEPGEFEVFIGGSSDSVKSKKFTLTE